MGPQPSLDGTRSDRLPPDKWDELARFEPIHPDLIAALPDRVALAVDVAAGSGRLTEHLAPRSVRIETWAR